jgi:hypothetical protein
MTVVDHFTATAADGPRVVEWLERNGVELECLEPAARRQVQRWRKGSQATFYGVDAVLIPLGLHPSQLPPSVWRGYDNGRRRR